MSGDRFVLLGLAAPRAEWFRSVARWATSATLPAEFLKCISAEELRARLGTGRVFSAALLDGGLAAVDRDLLDALRQTGVVAIVVDDGRRRRDWVELGAVAVLPSTFGPDVLLDALASHAAMVGRGQLHSVLDGVRTDPPPGWLAPVAVVCGSGGTGTSTAAAALAQGLADGRHDRGVLLADLCMHAEQAMLHDVRDVVPGLQELVESHRAQRASDEEIRRLTFAIEGRGYRLLLGLRRARYWSTVRPRAFEAAFMALREVFGVVVCDVTGDVEGEDDGGSVDVEERNFLARSAVADADVVFVVGVPGVKGIHALARLLGDLAAFDVRASRLQAVINRAPRSPRERAALAAAVGEIGGAAVGGAQLASPIFLPRRRVEEAVRDGLALPSPLPSLMAGAFRAVLTRAAGDGAIAVSAERGLRPIRPGSLGHWTDDADDEAGDEEVAG